MFDDQTPERTDIPMRSYYKSMPVNGEISLYAGPIRLEWMVGTSGTKGVSESEGTIKLNLQGKPDIRFDVTIPQPFAFVEAEGDLQIGSSLSASSVPYLMLKRTTSSSVGDTKVSGVISGEGIVIQELKANGKAESVGRVQFHLINFLKYRGDVLTEVEGQNQHEWLGRIIFSMGEWEITLDQFQDIESRLEQAKAVGGNVLTHIGLLKRKDAASKLSPLFDPKDAAKVFEALYWFLSFMNGALCAFATPVGLRHLGRPLWQQWGLYSTTEVDTRQNWFSAGATQECFRAADSFYTLWMMAEKREWLNLAIGLYLASNHNNGGIELALANSQILLEMLTWVALQEENTLMSNESFEKLPASDKIRALLFWLGVPTSIPEALKELIAAFPKADYPRIDAPEAVVKIRNLVIHPTKTNRVRRSEISNNAIYDAWQLNLWYADLTIFKLIGYSGRYNNRTGNPKSGEWDITP